MVMVGLAEAPNPSSLPGRKGCERWALAEAESWNTRQRVVLAEGHRGSAPGRITSHRRTLSMADNNLAPDMFKNMTGIASKIFNEKNLMPAILGGITIGGFTYVAIKGKTIRKARDIVDDVVTGMAGSSLALLIGGGSTASAVGMFVPAYAEIGDTIAEALIPIAEGGTELDVINDGDILVVSGGVALVSALAILIAAPLGEGPIVGALNDRLFG